MTAAKTYYITTAIAYVNGPPHLGHAYEVISTDVMARFKRLDGFDVFFLTGTDEHGQKVAKTAAAAGKEPKAFCDEIAALFKQMDAELGISYDRFIRTTEDDHYRASQAIWRRIAEAGDIYLEKYSGWYSTRDEAFFDESELTEGPDGKKLSPYGGECEWVEEPSYFFRLSAYTDRLLEHYEKHPDFIQPDFRRNEVVSFVRQGLRDLSISRTTFNWGVPVPDAPDHVMYVWLDALTNYITGLGFPDEGGRMATHWPADLHIIGKDIVRFHAVYWPAFLMSAKLPLPKRVFGHGFLNIEGAKMSKSLGNVLSPKALTDEFGLDQLRYFLLREVPYGSDGSFSREQIINRINSDLANDLGNLAQRVLSMTGRYCGGAVPQPAAFTAEDEALIRQAEALLPAMRAQIDVQAFHEALEAAWVLIRAANGYVDRQAPWTLSKTDPVRAGTVLYVLMETIRTLGILLQPFMPGSCAKLLDQLVIPADSRTFAHLGRDHALAPGAQLPKPQGVFPRFVDKDVPGEPVA
jgi:methionyl-tRNA synthetase